MPMQMAGNVFLKTTSPSKHEREPLVLPKFDPEIRLVEEQDGDYLHVLFDKAWIEGPSRQLVTTERLGKAKIPDLPFEHPDGSPYHIDTDYFGKARNGASPCPGPFEFVDGGKKILKVWSVPAP